MAEGNRNRGDAMATAWKAAPIQSNQSRCLQIYAISDSVSDVLERSYNTATHCKISFPFSVYEFLQFQYRNVYTTPWALFV